MRPQLVVPECLQEAGRQSVDSVPMASVLPPERTLPALVVEDVAAEDLVVADFAVEAAPEVLRSQAGPKLWLQQMVREEGWRVQEGRGSIVESTSSRTNSLGVFAQPPSKKYDSCEKSAKRYMLIMYRQAREHVVRTRGEAQISIWTMPESSTRRGWNPCGDNDLHRRWL